MTKLHLNIKQQIKLLPLQESLRTRILELTIFAKSYDLENDYSQFNLPQAFDWVSTREGGDFWVDIYYKLNKDETLQ
jgi:hypothetical protein